MALTVGAFAIVGSLKAQLAGLPRLPSALKTIAIGGSAAGVAFVIGYALQGLA